MAGEITVNTTLKVAKGSINFQQSTVQSVTLAAAKPSGSGFTQTIPTTAAGTAISLGGVAANGWGWIQNVDATNFIEIGVQVAGVFYPTLKLLAGESIAVRVSPDCVPYALANTGAVILQCTIFDA